MGLPLGASLLPGTAQFLLIGLAFWRHRPGKLLPTTASERQLWSIWIGYFLAFGVTALICVESADQEMLTQILAGHVGGGRRLLVSLAAVLSGLAFFVMGSSYWGGFYAIGLAFFILAGIMPLTGNLALMEYALLWSGTLLLIGLRLRRLGSRVEEAEK